MESWITIMTKKESAKNTSHKKVTSKISSKKSHNYSGPGKLSRKNTSAAKSPRKKQVFDDIMDFDEDWDKDWEHLEKEADADDWEEDFHISVSRKLLFLTAAGCALLCLVTVLFLFLPSQTRQSAQTAAALSFQPPYIAMSIPRPAIVRPSEPSEAPVGALDDAGDPQNSGAAGNEESGAEVTVSKKNEDETSDITLGIDVSKYQGTINWAEVKASGVDFAMIRVGYRAKSTGEIFEDPTARYNMQEAQAAGIKIGAYFFSSAITQDEAREEAAFTADIIARYKITYPVAFNCEDFRSPDSRQNGLDAAQRTQLACAFLDEISAAGYTPMFYASKGELEGNAEWNTDTLAAKYKIWVAQYPDKPYPDTTSSSYSGSHDMWQYTSQGTVAGIPKKTDVNIAYFGYLQEAEAKDATPAETVEANPEVGIIFTEVNETVTAKQETNLRSEPSTLNDESIVGKLVHGDTATRTGIGHNGWSRVIYNGQTLYAVTSYLTTDMNDTGQQAPPQGPVYTPVNEQVTAKMETNLRTEPSTASDDTIIGLLHNGETLTRTAIGDNGWSQLDYNGQTVYAVSSYLIVQ